MLEGPQRDLFDLSFAVPSACAEQLHDGRADIGIVPVAALLEQRLTIFRGTGIACRGAVRTILLISKKPFAEIRVLAVDSGSRTSVLLSRIVLGRLHGATPSLIAMPPELPLMLAVADAALVIGDAALLLDPEELRLRDLFVADLGEEWLTVTGLPMVFALWAGRAEVHNPANEAAFVDSCRYGLSHIDDIVASEHQRRGVSAELVRDYLTRNIVFEIGDEETRGLQMFLEAAAALPTVSEEMTV
jgi:predicted solute-binding protein